MVTTVLYEETSLRFRSQTRTDSANTETTLSIGTHEGELVKAALRCKIMLINVRSRHDLQVYVNVK